MTDFIIPKQLNNSDNTLDTLYIHVKNQLFTRLQ